MNSLVGSIQNTQFNTCNCHIFYSSRFYFLHICFNFPNILSSNICNVQYQSSWISSVSYYLIISNFVELLYPLISYFSNTVQLSSVPNLSFSFSRLKKKTYFVIHSLKPSVLVKPTLYLLSSPTYLLS